MLRRQVAARVFCRNTFRRLPVFRRCTISPSLTGTCDGEYRQNTPYMLSEEYRQDERLRR